MKPVIVELTDFKTKEVVDHLEVDAVLVATGRAPYTQVGACPLAPASPGSLLQAGTCGSSPVSEPLDGARSARALNSQECSCDHYESELFPARRG